MLKVNIYSRHVRVEKAAQHLGSTWSRDAPEQHRPWIPWRRRSEKCLFFFWKEETLFLPQIWNRLISNSHGVSRSSEESTTASLDRRFNGPQSNKSVYVVFQLSLEHCTRGCQRGKGSLIETSNQLTNLHSLVYGLINILLPDGAKTNRPTFFFSNAFGYDSVSNLVHHLPHNCLPNNQS